MRSFHAVVILAVLFFMTALPGPARAAGNVLLPTNQDNSPSSDDNATSSDDDTSSSPDQSQSSEPPAIPAAPQATPKTKPIPGSAANSSAPAAKNNAPLPAAPKMPTNVTKIKPVTKDAVAAWEKKLPNAISIGFADGATIGAHDTGVIKMRLGIPEDKIKDTCALVLNGNVRTDKSAYTPHVNPFSSHLAIKYAGQLKTASLNIMALCANTTLPANAGSIIQYGDKYLVALAHVSCPAPDQVVKQLAINYSGDGKGQCAYQ